MSEVLAHSPWLAAAGAALLAVVFGLAVHRAGGAVLRRASRMSVLLSSMVRACEHPAGAVIPLVALQVVWQAAPDTLAYIGTVRHANGLALIAALTWLAIAFVGGISSGVIARHPVDIADNLHARRIQTQAKVLSRTAMVVILIAGAAIGLMTFPGARQVGASLLASAGVIGIVGGIAARPVFSNLIAGLQLALAQPIRLDDVLIVEGEWGRVEEITGTYVVLKIWDERRLIVPLQWFIEHPFQNWTRTNAQIHQPVYLFVDFATPLAPLRAELERIVKEAPEWDGRTAQLVAVDATERAMKIRLLVSSGAAGTAFDLGCKVREGLLAFMAREYPQMLPKLRTQDPYVAGPLAS
ncbi:mechanosensitive ion channel family protein [Caenimonas aquaedulcis]|uniref:Mechanosensitive ion channel family protein n=1 Tax=Caenimonas aquaedulcis TaxID=2793270 RepID=A0A931MFX8_9BURK|nr:mechanosensitive ion channel family protein [Caenimonas aquaedulcis]MBG9387721.1 mechanosensitive ion channel family protein [Caenimonas aquaedulcis]